MNQQDLATCHCIISHPSKPKFMAVKHSDRWSPPVVMFPAEGTMVAKAKMITDGVMNKYGLKTTALRQLQSLPKYHCIELEMQSQTGSKNLEAAWVGNKEYQRFRSSSTQQFDPFEAWLKEKESTRIPELRPPWERPTWFRAASHWMQHQLDRLDIQATGSVEQFRVFRTASSILRVPTARGMVYFKACFARPPAEAALTQALARKWPKLVPAPLAVDEKKNWMLSMDYGSTGNKALQFSDYPEIARMLATIQLESLDSMVEWQNLACPVQELESLADFIAAFDRLAEVLSEGGGIALSADEFGRLEQMSDRLQAMCAELSAYSIPNTLVHPDIWYTNIISRDAGFSITDWSGTVISHPFFSVLKLIRFRELSHNETNPNSESEPKSEPRSRNISESDSDTTLITAILNAYLDQFTQFESMDRLNEAMILARALEGAWRLFKWQQAIAYEEHESVGYQRIARMLQRVSREMIAD